MAVAGVPTHAHCEICGTPVAVGTRFCGDKCEEKHEEIQADKKKFIWKQVAFLAALILIFTAFNRGWI